MNTMSTLSRSDLQILETWVAPQTRVLDLGCGDGTLLKTLQQHKNIRGYGLEIDRELIIRCAGNGVNVLEQDLDQGLENFKDNSFDTVVMTQTLQAMHRPDFVLDEMLRIGKECIVTFPNFGNWRARMHLTLRGRMPVTKQLSYQWYDTPNIHFCTVRDFEVLCREKHISVLHRQMVSSSPMDNLLKNISPNLFGETAVYHLSK